MVSNVFNSHGKSIQFGLGAVKSSREIKKFWWTGTLFRNEWCM